MRGSILTIGVGFSAILSLTALGACGGDTTGVGGGGTASGTATATATGTGTGGMSTPRDPATAAKASIDRFSATAGHLMVRATRRMACPRPTPPSTSTPVPLSSPSGSARWMGNRSSTTTSTCSRRRPRPFTCSFMKAT